VRDNRLYVVHVIECIARIENYLSGGRAAFMDSTLIQDAVIRNVQVLAESTQRLSDRLKDSHAEVDWRGLVALRNVLVHDYLGVNMALAWELVEQELPNLKVQMEGILEELGSAQ
jgi:uncharacterized protein with HEPN domain